MTATPRRAVLTSIAKTVFTANKGTFVVDIDRSGLLVDLLTFEEVVISSVHFGEIPFLVRMFGPDGLSELLTQGIIKIASRVTALAVDRSVNGVSQLPPNHYPQLLIWGQATREDCERALLQVSGLKRKRIEDLSQLIVNKDLVFSENLPRELHKQVRLDLSSNQTLVDALLTRDFPGLVPNSVKVRVDVAGRDVLHMESNLRDILSVSAVDEEAILRKLFGAVGTLNLRLALMQEYNAISAFEQSEVSLLFGKLAGIVAPFNPEITQTSFLRVLEITDVPQMLEANRVNVEKLIEVRKSNECREFRAWLASTDQISDSELKRLLAGFRARAASFVSSTSGKAVRFAVNTGLGLLPGYGTAMAFAEGAIDAFLLDRLLPSSGILTFLNKSVPSIFD